MSIDLAIVISLEKLFQYFFEIKDVHFKYIYVLGTNGKLNGIRVYMLSFSKIS